MLDSNIKPPVFYGWMVVWAGFAMSVAGIGARYCFGVFLKSIEGDFGMSRAATSGIFSTYMLLCFLVAIGGGWALDRFGPKKIGLVMGLFTGMSFILTSLVRSPWQLLVTYSLMLALGTGAIYGVVNTTASRWFVRKRGFVIGITSSGGGVGAIVLAPLAAYLIAHTGWRSAFFVVGVLIWLLISASALLLKKDPSTLGLHPDGDMREVFGRMAEKKRPASADFPSVEFSLRQSLRMNQFWLLVSAYLFQSLSLHMIFIHIVPYALDLGISPVDASLILSLIGLSAIGGRLGLGRLSDRTGRKTLGVICTSLHVATMLWLMVSSGLWMLYGFAAAFGILWGGSGTVMTSLIGDLFGTANLGRIMGLILSGWALGAAIGPAVGGYVFDVSGSYFVAFGIGALSLLSTAVSIALIRPISATAGQDQVE